MILGDNVLLYFINVNVIGAALIKGKFQENKEFLQWCHTYMLQICPDGIPKYPAYQKREFTIRARMK